jgi:hypothetical protein
MLENARVISVRASVSSMCGGAIHEDHRIYSRTFRKDTGAEVDLNEVWRLGRASGKVEYTLNEDGLALVMRGFTSDPESTADCKDGAREVLATTPYSIEPSKSGVDLNFPVATSVLACYGTVSLPAAILKKAKDASRGRRPEYLRTVKGPKQGQWCPTRVSIGFQRYRGARGRPGAWRQGCATCASGKSTRMASLGSANASCALPKSLADVSRERSRRL